MSGVNVAFAELESIRHRPREAKSFEEVRSLCQQLHSKFPEEPVVFLLEVYNYIRIGCFESALESASLFFDFFDHWRLRPGDKRTERRYSTLKHGLVLAATLHRIFGSFLPGSMLLRQTIANAHDNHDVSEFRFCSLEESAYTFAALNFGITPAFRRAPTRYSQVYDLHKRFVSLFQQFASNIPLTTLEDTYQHLVSAGFGSRTAQFKAVAQHFRIGLMFYKTLNAAIRCEPQERLCEYMNICLENEIAVKWKGFGEEVKDSVASVRSTVQLSNGNAALVERWSTLGDEAGAESMTEGRVIEQVNRAYSFAYQGDFEDALQVLQALREHCPEDANPMMAVHWKLAEGCILFDSLFFTGQFEAAEAGVRRLYAFSQPEAIFSLIDFVYNRFVGTELRSFLDKLHKGADPYLKIRTRIVLGTLLCASGQVAEGVAQLERAARSAAKSELAFLKAAADRRLAYGLGELKRAEALLDGAGVILDQKNVWALERFLFHATRFRLVEARAAAEPIPAEQVPAVLKQVHALTWALPLDCYPLLERSLYLRLSLFALRHLDNPALANTLARGCFKDGDDSALACFDWFAL